MNCLIKPKVKLYLVTYKVVLSTGNEGTGQSILTSHKPVKNSVIEDWKKILIKDVHRQYKYKVKVESLEIIKYEHLNAKRKEQIYGKNKNRMV